jgi:hypothetical protein
MADDLNTADLRAERAFLEAVHGELKTTLAGLDTAARAHFREVGLPPPAGACWCAAALALPDELARLRLLIARLRDDRPPAPDIAGPPPAPAELAGHLLDLARECHSALHEAAAQALLRLVEENARLREALRPLAQLARKGAADVPPAPATGEGPPAGPIAPGTPSHAS